MGAGPDRTQRSAHAEPAALEGDAGPPDDRSPAKRTPNGARLDRVARVGAVLLALLTAAGAVFLAAGSFLPYDTVKSHLDTFASDGDADLSPSEFEAIVVRLRIAAFGAALLSVALAVWRDRVRALLARGLASTATAAGSLVGGLRRALAEESRLHLAALGLITLAALLVRLEFLFQPMRYDESVTYVHFASQPWYIALTSYTAPNNHVLHSLLAHISTSVFGSDPWAIRLPALVAGVLLAPATYLAARALYGKHAALLGAGLVAGSSVAIEFSTNARGYSLLALLFVVLLALAARLRASASAAEWLAFAVLAALGFLVVPVMLYGLAALVLWLVLELWFLDRRLLLRRLVPAVVTTGALALLLYAPIVASSGLGALVRNEFVRPLPWSTFTSELPGSIASVLESWHRDVPLPLSILLAAGLVAGVTFHRAVSATLFPPALPALVTAAGFLAAQRVVPFERVWLYLLPLYLMTAAAGLLFIARPLTRGMGREGAVATGAAVLLAVGLGAEVARSQAVYRSEDTSTFRDSEAVSDVLERELRPGDKVLVAPPADAVLEYELGRRGYAPARLLYWPDPGTTERFLAVVKEGPDDYPLEHLLADPRLQGATLSGRVVERFPEATVYELRRRR